MNLKLSAAILAGFLVIPSAFAADKHPLGERSIFSERAIEERLEPVARVCMEGDQCQNNQAQASETTLAAADTALTPEKIYQTKCMACHATGAAGAPKSKADWEPRLAKGMDTLVQHAINGFNAMPPKGLCMECSDEDIKATVQYMTKQAQ